MTNFTQILLSFSLVTLALIFSFKGEAQTTISVEGSGDYHLHPTQYGPFLNVGDTLSGELAFIEDGQGNLSSACDGIAEDLTGKIAVIAYDFNDDEDCLSSVTKVENATAAGAKAVILVINDPSAQFPSNFGTTANAEDIPTWTVLIEDFDPVLFNRENLSSARVFYLYDHSETVLWSEDFGEGFNGPNGEWTSEGITSDTSLWIYAPDAQSKGSIRHFLIDSPTKGNGAVMLDTDGYLTENGNVPLPSDYPYGDVGAYLISPVIDLSDAGPVNVKWYQYCVGLNSEADSYIGFYYSTDGGETWSARENLTTNNVFNANATDLTNPEIMRVFVPDAVGASEFRFRIEFRSDLYAMLVDDIQIVEAPETDLAILGDPFYTPANYMQPREAINEDEFYFSLWVENKGSSAQENITLKAEIINADNNEIIETIEEVSDVIVPVGAESEFTIDQTFKPHNLETGNYLIRYTVIPEEEDFTPGDNVATIRFAVSENTYSQTSFDAITDSWYASNGNLVAVGNVYTMPAELDNIDKFKVNNINITYRNLGEESVNGKFLEILITEVTDEIDEDWENWDFAWSENPYNLPALNQVAYKAIPLDGTSEGELISSGSTGFLDAVGHTEIDEVFLDAGKRYIIWSTVEDNSLALGLSFDYQIIEPPAPFIYDEGDAQYYTYFTNGVQAIIQLEIDFSSAAEDQTLPENALNVYPNPVSGNFLYTKVELEENSDIILTVTDMQGATLSRNEYSNVYEDTVLTDISQLPAGTYLLKLTSKDGAKTVKFIKQ